MIRGARLTKFHEMIVRADVRAFDRRFAGYYAEGKRGLWDSLALTGAETDLASSLGILGGWRARRGSKAQIRSMREIDEARIGSVLRESGTFKPAREVLDYIMSVDSEFVAAQLALSDRESSIAGSPMSLQRLERLMAVNYAYAIRKRQAGVKPADIGFDMAQALFGNSDAMEQAAIASNPELLKIFGIKHSLEALWGEHTRVKRDVSTLEPDAEQSFQIPTELVELEALLAALETREILRLRSSAQKEAGLIKLVSTVAGMEMIMDGHEPDRTADESQGIHGASSRAYTQAEFQRDILLAGTVWRIINQLNNEDGLELFEATIGSRIREKVNRQAGIGEDTLAARAVLRARDRLAMVQAQFDDLTTQALGRMSSEGGASGIIPSGLQGWYRHLLASSAARQTDSDGRYSEARRRMLEELGSEQRLEDFPGKDRMLCYYGDTRPEDGQLGILEAVAAMNGVFTHIDTAGNVEFNPLKDGFVRDDLETIAGRMGFELEVHEPFGDIPVDYLCEAAILIGRMPRQMKATDILRILIPNSFMTMSWESNKALINQLRQVGPKIANFSLVPTQAIRFFRGPDGLLDFTTGHNIQGKSWSENTVIMFRNKDNNGTPSDLYDAFIRQARRAA
jgi:hypothetical protein